MSQGNAKTNTTARPIGTATGDLSGNYPNPTVSKLQNRTVSATAPLDGYVLTWDNSDGYWYGAPSKSNDVIFDAGSTSKNIISARPIHQSPIDNTKNGVVNLSSDTTNATVGATGNYSTIPGGDQNVSSGDYSSVIGGFQNTSGGQKAVVGGYSCSAGGNFSVACGISSNSSGVGSIALGYGPTATGDQSTAFGYQTIATRQGEFAYSSCCGKVSGAESGAVAGDAQSSWLVYAAAGNTTPFVLSDVNSNELTLASRFYYSMQIRIVLTAFNAAVGPATWVYEVLAHISGGIAVLDGTPTQSIITPDPNTTGWLTSVTVDGTTNKIHINVDPNGDTTNTINAAADIRWTQIFGFNQ